MSLWSGIKSIPLYIKMLLKGRPVAMEALDKGRLVRAVHAKSSWKSTEFWLTALSAIGSVLAQAKGLIPEPYGAVTATIATSLYTLSRGLAKNGDPMGGIKPGLTTTELITSLLNQAGVILAAISGLVDPATAAVLVSISNGVYGASRGLAKGGNQPPQ